QKLQAARAAADTTAAATTVPTPAPPAATTPEPAAEPAPPPQQARGKKAKAKPAAKPTAPAQTASPAPPAPAVPWLEALKNARMPLYDVHWSPAVVVQTGPEIRVGLTDGRVLPLSNVTAQARRALSLHDVVYVKASDGKKGARADLRIRPTVQGAALVLENKTGRILAMAGGFSYPLSQINRTTQTSRQPGSAFKPFTYLAALHKGLQPNTLVRDEPITLPPIGGTSAATRERDYWTPKNYSGGGSGILTLRLGLEYSKNLVTAQLLDGGISSDPSQSLAKVCELALEAQVYRDCVGYYPFVLGAQPVRLIDLAAFYAAVANEGQRPEPYAVEEVEEQGKTVYRHKGELRTLAGGDRAAFVQLESMLQGVLSRGTARAYASLSPYVAGKTGTSDDENDAWFVGFSNDVTIAVWVGYDNADGKRRTLGSGQTGGSVAVPIFAAIMDQVWAKVAKKTPLAPPSREAQKSLIALPIDLRSGTRLPQSTAGAFSEWFRVDRSGEVADTQHQMVSSYDVASQGYRDPYDGELYGYGTGGSPYGGGYGGGGWGGGGGFFQGFPFGWQQQNPYQRPQPYGTPYGSPYGQGVRPPAQVPGGLFGQLGRSAEPRYYGRDYPAQRVDPQYPYADRDRYW
ncbi:penicillin-binding transpeptidase domain-containing protein, partial [Rhodoplanes elegans]|uniref:penicillin-binding transpeptidase domain-containing protein n=2 Tax=Rhodoplanes elegans TaxID=29408 RepID=UPI00237C4A20